MSDTRTDVCSECNTETVADGERAGIRGGRLLCSDCADLEATFVVECLDCDFRCVQESPLFNWHATQQRVQKEGNNHEEEKRVFEDESHETVWRRANGQLERGGSEY